MKLHNKRNTMNLIIIILVLFELNVSAISVSCGSDRQQGIEKNVTDNIDKCDTMTQEDFFSIAKGTIKGMKEHVELSLGKVIVMVKVYNTLHIADVINSNENRMFADEYKSLFKKDYLKDVMKFLECTYGKGMTIYSKRHDLYVGVGSEFRCRDVYTVSQF